MKLSTLTAAVSLCFFGISPGDASANDATFNSVPVQNFNTGSLTDDGITFTVNAGHFDIFSQSSNDNYFNIDQVTLGLSKITITFSGGPFDPKSFDIIENSGNTTAFTISSNLGASFDVPNSTGPVNFVGPGFTGVSSLTIAQNSDGFLGLDNFIVNASAVPGPIVGAGLPGLLAGFGAMLAWYRKRRAPV